MMKKRVILSSALVLALGAGFIVSVGPAEARKLISPSGARSALSFGLAEAGISIRPEQVVVGSDGWLYLGDYYDLTFTRHRPPLTLQDEIDAASQLGSSFADWQAALEADNRGFAVVVAPNKTTIYPEFLPTWAALSETSAQVALTNALAGSPAVVFPNAALIGEKQSWQVYHQTDSHWTSYGAYLAYKQLCDYLESSYPNLELQALDLDQSDFVAQEGFQGELATLLYFGGRGSDRQDGLVEPLPTEVRELDWATGDLQFEGPVRKTASFGSGMRVTTQNPLNTTRVIWISDSFGVAMSDYVYATFSETVTFHYDTLNSSSLREAVEVFQPDLVIVTHAERALPTSPFRAGGLLSGTDALGSPSLRQAP